MRILYIYPHPMEGKIQRVMAGEIPSDSFYGLIELQKYGYEVSFSDSRYQGWLAQLTQFINNKTGFNLVNFKTLLNLCNNDVIVVKDRFSTLLTVACRVLNKKIVYVDALFLVPRNKIRKLIYKLNLMLSDGIVVFSKKQKELWSELFNIPPDRFKVIPYAIDVSFYKPLDDNKNKYEPFVLSVGRDQARDYKTLVDAMRGLGVKLKIVSLPYLLKDVDLSNPSLALLEYIPYEELFELYAKAILVVIPLKKWGLVYPSGIRGLLEAKAFCKNVIASHSPILEEYLNKDDGVYYVDPEDVSGLRKKIVNLLENPKGRGSNEAMGREMVEKNYNLVEFATSFGDYIKSPLESPKGQRTN